MPIDAVKRGYDCLKVKVGSNPALDVARLAAIRAAVPKDICVRIDANQAWKPKEAVRILNEMQEKGLDIEFVEQPVIAHDFEGLKYVTERSYVPVLADESVFSPEDALKIMPDGRCRSCKHQTHEMRRHHQRAENCFRSGGLWRGVHDRLHAGGQNQRYSGGAPCLCKTDHHKD